MFIEIIKAEYLDEYRLRLWFNNGKVKDVDLSDSLKGKIFVPLQDKEFFRRFSIRFNTIEWENGADFAPEYLYEKGVNAYEPQDIFYWFFRLVFFNLLPRIHGIFHSNIIPFFR